MTIWYVNGVVVCDAVVPDENGETACELSLGLEDTEITLAVQDAENSRGEDTIIVRLSRQSLQRFKFEVPRMGCITLIN